MVINRKHMAFLRVLYQHGMKEWERVKAMPEALRAGEIENASITTIWGNKENPGPLVQFTAQHEQALGGNLKYLQQIYRIAEECSKNGLIQDYLQGKYKGRFVLTPLGMNVSTKIADLDPAHWPVEMVLEAGKIRIESGLPRASY